MWGCGTLYKLGYLFQHQNFLPFKCKSQFVDPCSLNAGCNQICLVVPFLYLFKCVLCRIFQPLFLSLIQYLKLHDEGRIFLPERIKGYVVSTSSTLPVRHDPIGLPQRYDEPQNESMIKILRSTALGSSRHIKITHRRVGKIQ